MMFYDKKAYIGKRNLVIWVVDSEFRLLMVKGENGNFSTCDALLREDL